MPPLNDEVSRRSFLERMGAGALLAGTGRHPDANPRTAASGGKHGATSGSWSPPPALKNPNILLIMVDQMRFPAWLTVDQSSLVNQSLLPNIVGRIQNSAYNFGQYFCVSTPCTPARAALLTGLYAPQTAMYTSSENAFGIGPALNPAFPTWADALAVLNPAYQGNAWWFGKWHLSANLVANPLLPYGFNTRLYPGGPPPYNPSPNGTANEGTGGGSFQGITFASDAMIAGDFIGWLQGQAPSSGLPSSPWCATVSLINPHDIASAPGWMQTNPFPPPGVALKLAYFPPPVGTPPAIYSSTPSTWNYENLQTVANKPAIQAAFQSYCNAGVGAVTDWTLFLNQYFWLQGFVDQQVGAVLNALYSSPFANNTVIIFMADHGELGGSHGLHDKGWEVYEESLHVPLSVQFPGQTSAFDMSQMCSSVDFFGLVCDLATGGSGQWRLAYPDLSNRQSLWSFLYNNSSETRVAPAPVGLPYVFHTFDDPRLPGKSHIVCVRSKLDLNAGAVGAKLAFYSEWADCQTYPDATPPDPEFYDYNPQAGNNTPEIGNDFFSNNAQTQQALANHIQVLGSLTPPYTGLVAGEINRPLVGKGTDGNTMTQAQVAAQQAYLDFVFGIGICTA